MHQKAAFPASETSTTTLTVSIPDDSIKLALKIRVPKWTQNPSITINGEAVAMSVTPGSYATIDREWKDGDTVEAPYTYTTHTRAHTGTHTHIEWT